MLEKLHNLEICDYFITLGIIAFIVGLSIIFQNVDDKKTEINLSKVEVIENNILGISNDKEKISTIVDTKQEFVAQKKQSAQLKNEYIKIVDKNQPTQTPQLIKVNLNKADISELDKLNGIGPAIAQRIIDYRSANNGFKNIEEIKLVKGIGDKMYEKIRNNIEL